VVANATSADELESAFVALATAGITGLSAQVLDRRAVETLSGVAAKISSRTLLRSQHKY